MKRLTAFLAVVGLMMTLTGCGGGDAEVMTYERWISLVHIGMTQDEVIAAIGRSPDRQYHDSRYVVPDTFYAWRFDNDEGAIGYGVDGTVVICSYTTNLYGE